LFFLQWTGCEKRAKQTTNKDDYIFKHKETRERNEKSMHFNNTLTIIVQNEMLYTTTLQDAPTKPCLSFLL